MTEQDRPAAEGAAPPWVAHRTLTIAWLLAVAPVGLYALWRGDHFDQRTRWIITGVVVFALLLLLGGPLIEVLLIFVTWPVALYLLWKDSSIKRRTLNIFGAVFAVLFLMFLSGAGQNGGNIGGQCAATFTQNGCTYYRDSDCNVIGQSCN